MEGWKGDRDSGKEEQEHEWRKQVKGRVIQKGRGRSEKKKGENGMKGSTGWRRWMKDTLGGGERDKRQMKTEKRGNSSEEMCYVNTKHAHMKEKYILNND